MSLKRYEYGKQSVTIAQAVANSTDIEFDRFAAMMIISPAGWSSSTVTFYQLSPIDGTSYSQVMQADGTALSITLAASKSHEAPPELFACGTVRLVSSVNNDSTPCGVTMKG